jgi:transposase
MTGLSPADHHGGHRATPRQGTGSLPTLSPRDVVVMDNLNSHKGGEVRQLIRSAGAHLYFLPAYSPDLNPIEQAFAKIKGEIRKRDQRTVDGLWKCAGEIIQQIDPAECANYLRNAGYQSV